MTSLVQSAIAILDISKGTRQKIFEEILIVTGCQILHRVDKETSSSSAATRTEVIRFDLRHSNKRSPSVLRFRQLTATRRP